MFTYPVKIEIAKPQSSINLKNKEQLFLDAIKSFNESSDSMQNSKTLHDVSVSESYGILTLNSDTPLKSVGRALRKFVCDLLNSGDEELKNACTPSGALFRYTLISAEAPEEEINVSDSELIKSLIDYVCSNRDTNTTIYRKKRKAIEEMKKVAIEAGIIRFAGGLK